MTKVERFLEKLKEGRKPTRETVEEILRRLDMKYGIEYEIREIKDWRMVLLLRRRPPYRGIDAGIFETIIKELEKAGWTLIVIEAEMGYIKLTFIGRWLYE
ncbi:MAG: hypothetical protein ACTSXW_08415 [Candidatus Baldrarchaeia archaeon]